MKKPNFLSDNQIYETIRFILGKIKNNLFKWRIEGSANLKIQGIKVDVRDLDIATDKEGIDIFC